MAVCQCSIGLMGQMAPVEMAAVTPSCWQECWQAVLQGCLLGFMPPRWELWAQPAAGTLEIIFCPLEDRPSLCLPRLSALASLSEPIEAAPFEGLKPALVSLEESKIIGKRCCLTQPAQLSETW